MTVTVLSLVLGGDNVATDLAPRRPRPLTEFQLREHAQSILKRVVVTRLAERVERMEPGWYVVRSTSTTGSHVIKGPPRWRFPWELRCECHGDVSGGYPLCVHIGAVLVARWQHQGYTVLQGLDGRVVVARDAVDVGVPFGEYPAKVQAEPGDAA